MVPKEVTDYIITKLIPAFEQDHDVEILVAYYTGSRGIGYARPDSDYDIQLITRSNEIFTYITNTDIKFPNYFHEIKDPSLSGKIDIQVMDIRNFLSLASKGNTLLYFTVAACEGFYCNQDVLRHLIMLASFYLRDPWMINKYFTAHRSLFSKVYHSKQITYKQLVQMLVNGVAALHWVLTYKAGNVSCDQIRTTCLSKWLSFCENEIDTNTIQNIVEDYQKTDDPNRVVDIVEYPIVSYLNNLLNAYGFLPKQQPWNTEFSDLTLKTILKL